MSKTLAAALVSLHYVISITSVFDQALSPCRSPRGYDIGFRAASHVRSLGPFRLVSVYQPVYLYIFLVL